jgi:8-oxo-dGTP pyrophosphatase MutT (NUDIX family)
MQRFSWDDTLRARLSGNLARFQPVARASSELSAAAVALTLLPDANGEACFLLTRRVATLQHHAGQFALPGGRLDEVEDAASAARRELQEELGVELDASRVLGSLDDFVTRSGFVITPVVLWGDESAVLKPNPDEVAIAYRVPVRALYGRGVPTLHEAEEPGRPLLSLPLLGTHIFSPTAAILFQLREVVFEGLSTRVAHFDQPRFAWK